MKTKKLKQAGAGPGAGRAGQIPIHFELDQTIHDLLAVLNPAGDPRVVILQLIDHAQQGVYRPGAWERHWIIEAFGMDWLQRLEAGDPRGQANCETIFQKPKERRCRVCGCTWSKACITREGPCHWIDWDLCSACQSKPEP